MSKDLKGNVKKTPAASIDSLPSCDSEDVSDIELPILKLDIGKGRDEGCNIDSDEDDIFKGFEYGEDETDVSVIDSGEKGKKQTLSISDNDEDEDQEDYTKYSWFWEDGQRLTDSQYRIENDEELTTATTATVDVDATAAAATTAAAGAAAAAATATTAAAAAAAAAATATGACSDATNVENYGDMFDTETDSLMSRADIDLIQFMDNYIIENGIIEDHDDVIFNLNVHNPANTYDDDDDDDDIENDSADDDDDDNMENENYSADDDDDDNMENDDDLETDTYKTNMDDDDDDDDDDDELISMVQYEY